MLVATRTVAEELKRLRAQTGLTAYKVAQLAGVPRSNLSEFESGKLIPTDDALAKLAPHLGASAAELKALAALDRMAPDARAWLEEHPEVLALPAPTSSPKAKPTALMAELGIKSGGDIAKGKLALPPKGVAKPPKDAKQVREVGQAWGAASSPEGEGMGRINPPMGEFDDLDGEGFQE